MESKVKVFTSLPFLKKLAEKARSGPYWHSFHDREHFEFGIMSFPPNHKDPQQPHKSDEVYYILHGDGFLNIDGDDFPIEEHNIFYVPKGTTHFFHSNSKHIEAFYVLN